MATMAVPTLKAPRLSFRNSLVTADSLPTQLPHTLSEARLLLREDDSLLRNTFFEIVYHHHPNLADRIDEIYKLSLAWCNSESDQDFQALEKILSGLNPDELILVRCPVGASDCLCPKRFEGKLRGYRGEAGCRSCRIYASVKVFANLMQTIVKQGVDPGEGDLFLDAIFTCLLGDSGVQLFFPAPKPAQPFGGDQQCTAGTCCPYWRGTQRPLCKSMAPATEHIPACLAIIPSQFYSAFDYIQNAQPVEAR